MPREKSIAERFDAFVEKVGGRLHKPNRRFLKEAVFGLVQERSVLLSQIGRALEEDTRLIHTEKRLSRNLMSSRYNDAAVEEDYLKLVAPVLRDERYPTPTIAVDITDIAKPRAKKMPYLSNVHDGSKDEVAKGYLAICVEAVGEKGRRLPLLSRLFSAKAPDFRSQNVTTLDAVAAVLPHVPKGAFWAFDRGFDGHVFYNRANELGLNFAVRMSFKTNRDLYVDGERSHMRKLVAELPLAHQHRSRLPGWIRSGMLKVGWVKNVQLPYYRPSGFCTNTPAEKRYSVVVAHNNLNADPLVILTTMDVQTADDAVRVVDTYLERWGIEEANRFIKQGFDLEDVRALTWTGLKRMMQLVQLAYGFLALLVHGPRKQVEQVASTFKAFGPVPVYLYYRLLEGIGRVLRRSMDGGP